ncbi:hypothetical protein CCP3SC15_320009 [Gammaproteobacteria bacterium]
MLLTTRKIRHETTGEGVGRSPGPSTGREGNNKINTLVRATLKELGHNDRLTPIPYTTDLRGLPYPENYPDLPGRRPLPL